MRRYCLLLLLCIAPLACSDAALAGLAPEHQPNIALHALYEFMLPIDAILFLAGAYRLSKSEREYIVSMVLQAKASLLKDPSQLELLSNYSTVQRGPAALSKLLHSRYTILSTDDSAIGLQMLKGAQRRILARLQGQDASPAAEQLRKSIAAAPEITNRDAEYRDMIKRLLRLMYEDGPLNRVLEYEKEEFYRIFRDIRPDEVARLRNELSLGSAVVNTTELPQLVASISGRNKEELVRKWVERLMGLVEALELRIRTKPLIEAKRLARRFLQNCLQPGTEEFDTAYALRSELFGLAGVDDHTAEYKNWQQDRHVKAMIGVLENIRETDWLVKYNRDIKDDYNAFLLTGLESDKRKLLQNFG
ncbi:hypothetical protein PAPHI01_1583 [Pancytospora philotis]|nr:hypothetical protein PAPHI01_1583 [Pancytospora philotis]